MAEIELRPGTPFCSADELNRIARQQGLCLAIAQASIFDEICRSVALSSEREAELVETYCLENDLNQPERLEEHLHRRGWQQQDLVYFATKQERLSRFQQLLFAEDVELRFLASKTDLDTIRYSLIRSRDGDLAFELHQRLLEQEASFEELAATFSEGAERDHGGQVGPVPLSQAHPVLVEKLRISHPGQLWEPFFLKDIWVILRLDEWQGARLDDATRQDLQQDLFEDWLHQRALQLLNGEEVGPLPLHRLSQGSSSVDQHDSQPAPPQQTPQPKRNQVDIATLINLGNCQAALPWVQEREGNDLSTFDHLLLSIFHRHCGDQVTAQQQLSTLMDQNVFDSYVSMIVSQCFALDLDGARTTALEALEKEILKQTTWRNDQRAYFNEVFSTLQYAGAKQTFQEEQRQLEPCSYYTPNQLQPSRAPGFTEHCGLKLNKHDAVFNPRSGSWRERNSQTLINDLLHPSHDFRHFIGHSSPELDLGEDNKGAKTLEEIHGPSIYIDFNPHFGHFITHSCAFAVPLLAAEDLLEGEPHQSINILSTTPITDWARNLLEAASTTPLTYIQIPVSSHGVRASQLITTPSSWIEWHYCNSNHRDLFQAMASKLQLQQGSQDGEGIQDKIYLSRSRITEGLRTSINEDVLEAELSQRGFSILHPQEMTLSQLIPALSRAQLVAGPVGSAMHNILFANNQDQLTTLNFCHHLANNVILIENICQTKRNLHSFSTYEEVNQGKSCLRFDIDACLDATDAVLSTF